VRIFAGCFVARRSKTTAGILPPRAAHPGQNSRQRCYTSLRLDALGTLTATVASSLLARSPSHPVLVGYDLGSRLSHDPRNLRFIFCLRFLSQAEKTYMRAKSVPRGSNDWEAGSLWTRRFFPRPIDLRNLFRRRQSRGE
jgi:hypothetical protein